MHETPHGDGHPEEFKTYRMDPDEFPGGLDARIPSDSRTIPPAAYEQTRRLDESTEAPDEFVTRMPTGSGSSEFDLKFKAATGGLQIRKGMRLFDEYDVEDKIGEGGMGSVWKVHNEGLGTSTALKVIVETNFTDEARERFRREAKLMALVKHPNAVVVHRSKVTRELAFIEMEYLKGKSLDRIIQRGDPVDLPKIARILEQLCGVLEYAHEQVYDNKGRSIKIVHRDLKPSNLMILDDRTGGAYELKVLDFGIAKQLDLQGADAPDPAAFRTGTGAALFTLPYASPEQISAKPDINEKTDIYSVGVILYELLTGFLPFVEPGLIYKQLMEAPPTFAQRNPRANCPPAIEALVMRCLSKKPAERPSARELCDLFFAALPPDLQMLPRTVRQTADSPSRIGRRPTQTLPKTVSDREHGESVPTIRDEPGFAGNDLRTERGPGTGWRNPDSGVGRKKKAAGLPLPAMIGGGIGLVGLVVAVFILMSIPKKDEAKGGGTPPPPPPPPVASKVPAGYEAVANQGEYNGYPMKIRRIGSTNPEVVFILIPGGRFRWGGDRGSERFKKRFDGAIPNLPIAPPNDDDSFDDLPERDVIVSSFYIQETEVTNGELQAFMKKQDASDSAGWLTSLGRRDIKAVERYPAVSVTRPLARKYARSVGGDLPSELQWEFTARSGESDYHPFTWFDPAVPSDPNVKKDIFIDQSVGEQSATDAFKTSKDRTKQGVLGMLGNVREWCIDDWAIYPREGAAARAASPVDPPPHVVPDGVAPPVVRGGSWRTFAERCETTWPRRLMEEHDLDTLREWKENAHARDIGFRVVLPLPKADHKTDAGE